MKKTSVFRSIIRSKSIPLLIVLAAVLGLFYVVKPAYLSPNNIRNIMNVCSITGMIAIGMGVLLISGNIDLSAASIGMFASVILAILMSAGTHWIPALIIAVLFGVAAGTVNALLSFRLKIMPFIVTIAMASFWQGLGGFVTNNQSIPIASASFGAIGSYKVFGWFPLPFVIYAALALIYGYILTSTNFGRKIFMCGGNPTAAHLAGINVRRINFILMVNCGAISALSGCIHAAKIKTVSCTSILGTDFDSITACCLGGIAFMGGEGGMLGALLGVLLLGSFKNGLTIVGFSTYWQLVVSGVLLVVALSVDYASTRLRSRAIGKRGNRHYEVV